MLLALWQDWCLNAIRHTVFFSGIQSPDLSLACIAICNALANKRKKIGVKAQTCFIDVMTATLDEMTKLCTCIGGF